MDIHSLAVEYFTKLPVVSGWPEMVIDFEGLAAKKPGAWKLPLVACKALGGVREDALPAVVAVACMQMSIILIDDMLDEDPRGKYNANGHAETANLASAYQAAGLQAVAKSTVDEEIKLAVQASLNKMMLMTALGQTMDIENPKDEEGYWEMVRTKSCPYYAAALYCGALFGGATFDTAEQIERFGRLYGEIIQIHDDLGDTMATPANPDWIQGRFPLPLLFAHVVDHPDRERLIELRQKAENPEALEEAQAILIRSGAVSYCLDQLVRRYQTLKELRSSMDLVDPAGLDQLLYEVVHPVNELIKALGAEVPAALQEDLGTAEISAGV